MDRGRKQRNRRRRRRLRVLERKGLHQRAAWRGSASRFANLVWSPWRSTWVRLDNPAQVRQAAFEPGLFRVMAAQRS